MKEIWTHGIDLDSSYRLGLMVYTRPCGMDSASWFRLGLMVLTWTYGRDLDSWYRPFQTMELAIGSILNEIF